MFGLVVDIGLKFLSAPTLSRGISWGHGHRLRIFINKSKFLCYVYIAIPSRPFEEFHLYYIDRYRSRVLLSIILILGYDLEVKVTHLEISYKSKKKIKKKKKKMHLSLYSYIMKTLFVGFINIKHDGIYRSEVFLRTIPKLGHGF